MKTKEDLCKELDLNELETTNGGYILIVYYIMEAVDDFIDSWN